MGCIVCGQKRVSYFSLSILDEHKEETSDNMMEIKMPEFTPEELAIAESTWNTLKCRFNNRVGFEIFRQIFAVCPQVKSLFGVQNKTDWNALNHHKMERHTAIFQDIIELLIVDIAKQSDALTQSLITLGAQHWFFSQRGFRPEYWIIFGDTLVNLIRTLPLSLLKRRLARRTWIKMIVYLLDCVQLGFLRQMRESNETIVL